jgi:hypothetical protein
MTAVKNNCLYVDRKRREESEKLLSIKRFHATSLINEHYALSCATGGSAMTAKMDDFWPQIIQTIENILDPYGPADLKVYYVSMTTLLYSLGDQAHLFI